MGSSYKGNTANQHSLSDNLPDVTKSYPLSKEGHFGSSHNRNPRVREIFSDDPDKAAKDFYDKIGLGGEYKQIWPSGQEMIRLKDGTIIVYCPITSSPGSPAVVISIKKSTDNGHIKDQKIHFVRIKKGNE
jgi:hypothetical protein